MSSPTLAESAPAATAPATNSRVDALLAKMSLEQKVGQLMVIGFDGATYDPGSGQMIAGSFMDYALPRADDLPYFDLDFHSTPCTTNPLGVKGCGEAGAIGASAAVINAITDAIGNNRLEMPATPDRVWHAIHGNA